MPTKEEDDELLRQAASGDAGAISALFREMRPRLIAYVQRHCPPKVARQYDVEDILQDVLFEAFRRLGQFESQGEDSLFRWFVTITRNRMLALLRMENTEKRGGNIERLSPDEDADMIRIIENLVVYRRTPSQSAMSHEAMEMVERSILNLPEDYQRVITLRFIDGKNHQEIGQAMQRTEEAARTLCHRALKELRKELGSASMFL